MTFTLVIRVFTLKGSSHDLCSAGLERNKIRLLTEVINAKVLNILFDFSLTVKAEPHECVIRTGQP